MKQLSIIFIFLTQIFLYGLEINSLIENSADLSTSDRSDQIQTINQLTNELLLLRLKENVRSANLREEPWGKILLTIRPDMEIEYSGISERSPRWIQARVQQTDGYIHHNLILTNETQSPASAIVSVNKAFIRNGIWGRVAGVVERGTHLNVIREENGWLMISYNNREVWISKKCVNLENLSEDSDNTNQEETINPPQIPFEQNSLDFDPFKTGNPQLPNSESNIYNIFAIKKPVGINKANDTEDVKRIQRRLLDLGFTVNINGIFDSNTQQAISSFQNQYRSLITRIQQDSRREAVCRGIGNQRGTQGKSSVNGVIVLNDATFQALVQLWPKRINGNLMTIEQAYDFLKEKAQNAGIALQEDKIHIIGIRGFQGGAPHNNRLFGTSNNPYDDTFFVISPKNKPDFSIYEFKGSTDRGPGSASQKAMLIAHQQIEYQYSPTAVRFGSRPCFWMKEDARVLRKDNRINSGKGIAIHTGGRGEKVGFNSSGCMVPQGSWFGHFTGCIERMLGNCNRIKFTILDGQYF